MGLIPEFRGVEHFAADARPRRSDARAALMFACALVLGAAGSLGPIQGPAFVHVLRHGSFVTVLRRNGNYGRKTKT